MLPRATCIFAASCSQAGFALVFFHAKLANILTWILSLCVPQCDVESVSVSSVGVRIDNVPVAELKRHSVFHASSLPPEVFLMIALRLLHSSVIAGSGWMTHIKVQNESP